MNTFRITAILISSILFRSGLISAQTQLRYTHYTTQEGLPSNLINCVEQDQKGFLWFGTDEGLSRFDGYDFINYQNSPADSSSLTNNVINDIFCDHAGRLWIATSDGMSLYLPGSDRYHSFFDSNRPLGKIHGTHIIYQIAEDRLHRLWLATDKGIILVDSTGKTADYLVAHDQELNQFFQTGIDYIYFHNNQVWAGSTAQKGMRIFDFDRLIDLTNSVNSIFRDSTFNVSQMMIENDSIAWFANETGFFHYNLVTKKMSRLLKKGDTSINFDYTPSGLMIDDENNIWVSFNFQRNRYSSIAKVDRSDLSLEFYNYNELDPRGLTWAHCRFIFEDKTGLFWVGTSRGLNLMNPSKQEIKLIQQFPDKQYNATDNIYGIARTGNKIWLGTDGEGMFSYDMVTHNFHLAVNPHEDSTLGIYVIQPLQHDRLMLGSQAGYVFEFDEHTEKLKTLLTPPPFLNLSTTNVSAIATTDSVHFWIGYMGVGFIYYDLQKHINKSFRHDPDQINSPSSDQVNSILADPNGSIWIAYSDGTNIFSAVQGTGIDKFEPATGKFFHYRYDPADQNSISHNTVTALRMDSKGNLWIGTKQGLNKMDTATGKCIRYTHTEGMPFEHIASIEIDREDNVWVTSWVNGLVCIRADNGSIIHFDKGDGLQDLRFNRGASFRDKEGNIYFGGVAGMNIISPSNILWQNTKVPIYITQLNINTDRFTGDVPVYDLKKISLTYKQSDIEFQFVALDYNGHKNMIYQYQLNGYEDKWNSGNTRSAKYTNLDPGNYTFNVRTVNTITGETGNMVSLQIFISPPFYQTFWFRSIAGLFVIAIGWSILRMRTSALRRQKLALENTVHERTQELVVAKERAERSEQFKQQFLANMSHEIRTPMNAVSGMTDLLIEKKHLPEQEKYLIAIQRSSESLLHIINDILDLSKVEAGKLELESVDFSVRDVVQEVMQTLKIKSDEKGLFLVSHVDNQLADIWLGDPHRLKQILINLLGNAIKFTEKGSVELRVELPEEQSEGINFRIIDTGIGIPEDKLETVFESFKQAQSSDSRKYGGTGLGLSISKQLIELQGGRISVKSKVGEGTEFNFLLPLHKGSELNYKKQSAQINSIDATALNGLRILLADDNEYNRIVAMDSIQSKAEVMIDEAVNGHEVIDLLKNNNYDLILMDVQMPEMSGFEATQIIRREFGEPKKSIPIIALTASVLRTDLDKCRQAGMNSYVPKPFKTAQLLEEIAKVVGKEIKIIDHDVNNKKTYHDHEKITDLSFLEKFTEGDKTAMKKYIDIYLEKTKTYLKNLDDAIRNKDYDTIRSVVHTMKAHCKLMGMNETSSIAVLAEEAIDSGATVDIEDTLRRLMADCNTSIHELKMFSA